MPTSEKLKVVEDYNLMGGRIYDLRYSEEQQEKYDIIQRHMGTRPTGSVLDLGCGTGLLLQRLDPPTVGLDISEALLTTARERLKDKPASNLVRGDAETLPFRDSTFHLSYAVTLLQNTPDPIQVLKEIRRVSTEESRVAITALKKSFTRTHFESVLAQSNFDNHSLIEEKDTRDWIAIATV
ncbi:MAG: methyltransferase domain-containing protein [Candidatus Bathyarchaeota archaeon]|jgi:ubiquinone/menaquinone biosynthesis C-methylase UbiE